MVMEYIYMGKISIQEALKLILSMVMGWSNLQMEIYIMDSITMVNLKGKEHIFGVMGQNIEDNLKMELGMVRVFG